jgi:hypothetical protein
MRSSAPSPFSSHSLGFTLAPSAPLPETAVGFQRSRSLPNLTRRTSSGPMAPGQRNTSPVQNIFNCDDEITPRDNESDASSVMTDVTDCLKNMGLIEEVPEPVGEVDMTTLKIQKNNILGRGVFGCVYRGDIVVDNVKTPCAVKISHHKNDANQKTEAKTLADFNNKNVIKIFGFHEENNRKAVSTVTKRRS